MSEPAAPQQAPPAAKPPRRRGQLIAGGIVALAGLFIIVGLWLAYRPAAGQLQGMVEAEELTIATKAPLSRVERLLVDEGAQVRTGQLLAQLASPEIAAKQTQAEGLLDSARAVNQRAVKGAREEDIASLKAVWNASQAAADLAQKTYVRASNLYAQGVVAAQRRDEALAARDASARQAEAARLQYLKVASGATVEEKTIAASQVRIAQAGMAETASLQAETTLRAPADGEIGKKLVNDGEIVPLGFPVFTLTRLSDPWVTLNVPESQFHGLRTGQILTGEVPALDLKNVRFRVDYISPAGEFATWRATRQSSGYDIRSFEVKVRPVARIGGLRPGMSVLFAWPQTRTF
ncbi:HlyD family secretion protein [Caulobacter segnis]|uniref:Hemolysin secretion protein D n=1 Tax=Caulobacter segnis TaxID=88688 RepID=A0A2W5VJ09_9CAUL|nr:efflux RND transporter periplasmic adaptor subunit [Caulobacter segnis]PZR36666.1 MAG: hemolysin secretion protein D [Caulobacter segnis]